MKGWPNRYYFIIIVIGTLVVKYLGILGNEIALDEPFTLFWSQQSLSEIFCMLKTENNGAFHFVFMHYWIKLGGLDPEWVRLPGVICTAVAAGYIFKLGEHINGFKTGMIAATLFLCSNFVTIFAHEVRVYPFVLCFGICSMYIFMRWREKPTIGRIVTLAILNALLFYGHFLSVIIPIIQGVYIVGSKELRGRVKSYVSHLLSLALSIPALIHLATRTSKTVSNGGTWIDTKPQFDSIYNIIWKFSNVPVAAVLLIVIVTTGLAFSRLKNVNERLLWAWFLLPTAGIIVVSFWFPLLLDRYMLMGVPGLFLLAAFYSEQYYEKSKWLLAPAVVVCITMLLTNKLFIDNNRPLDQVASRVSDYSENSHVYLVPSWIDIRVLFHIDREAFHNYSQKDEYLRQRQIYSTNNLSTIKLPALIVDGGADFVSAQLEGWLLKADSVRVYKGYRLIYISSSE